MCGKCTDGSGEENDYEYWPIDKREGRVFTESPFFPHFEERYIDVKKRFDDGSISITNVYYNDGIAVLITQRFMPFACVWSGILISRKFPEISRISNAYAESHFNVVKHEVLKHEKNLKIGRFVTKEKKYVQSLVAELKIKIPVKRRTKLKAAYPEHPTNKFATECWKPKKQTKFKAEPYSKGKNTKRAVEKINERNTVKLRRLKNRRYSINSIDDKGLNSVERVSIAVRKAEKSENRQTNTQRITKKRKYDRIESVSDSENDDCQISGELTDAEYTTKTEPIIKKQKKTNTCMPMTSKSKNDSIDCDEHNSNDDIQSINESDNSFHSLSLPNALFLDVEYYMQSPILPKRKHDKSQMVEHFSLRIFSYVAHKNPILCREKVDLFNTEFATLAGSQWLDGKIIDSFVTASVHGWGKVVYIPTKYTSYIIGDFCNNKRGKNFLLYNIHQKITGKLIMPYLRRSHWRVFVADVKEKTLMLLDPVKCAANEEYDRVHRQFTKFIDMSPNSMGELQNIEWKRVYNNDRPYQADSDSNNCGIYVLHYIKSIGENVTFGKKLNISEF